jgi:HlyD family secretion protein
MADEMTHATTSSGSDMDRRVERLSGPLRRSRAVVVAVLTMLAISGVWFLLPASGSTDIAGTDIESGVVARAPFADYLPLRATVAPRETTLVGVLVGGQVETLLVQDGAMVSAGQSLARLANPELRLDVLTREAQIAAQLGDLSGQDLGIERNRLDRTSQIAQANYDLIKARRELSIRQQLHAQGIVSDAGVRSFAEEAAYQQKRLAQLQSGGAAEARITATQEARLADTRNRLSGNLAAVRSGLDLLVLRASTGGRLTNFTIQPGQTLKPGDPAGQIDSEDAWKLVADVDEFYLSRIAVNQSATADGDKRLTITKVLPAVSNGRFRVELQFDDAAAAKLKRGQTLDIRVTLGSTAPAMVAPVGAWLDSGGGSSVFVIDADGRHARRRPVKIGRRNPEQAEIIAGLAVGERIVMSNTSSVKGDILNIR